MWNRLTLRTRILLGYGLILALAAGLALLLVLRIDALSERIQQLSISAAAEAQANTRVASRLAVIQRTVGNYIQQPDEEPRRVAHDALQQLAAEIARARAVLLSPAQIEQLDDLERRRSVYQHNVESFSLLISEQRPIRDQLNLHLGETNKLLNGAIANNLVGGAQVQATSELVGVQADLQQASVWIARMIGERADDLGSNALAELGKAKAVLERRNISTGAAGATTDDILRELAETTDLTNQLIGNITLVRSLQKTLLAQQESILERQASAVTQNAVMSLTDATKDLVAQTRQVRQLAGLALALTLLLAAAIGLRLAQTITRPLKELVAAAMRLNQGDYGVAVSERAGGEIGQLAAMFNQMTAALNQQRTEVRCQQEAMARRNQELEQALAEVRVATEAREAMAATVRTLSVPVVSILEHVVVLPLVGEIDMQRGQVLLERLLAGASEQRARIAILDVTGVPFVDTSVVDVLIKAATATSLIGARCVLVGISPEVAQAIVTSGASLDGIVTRADLRSAVEYAMQQLGSRWLRAA